MIVRRKQNVRPIGEDRLRILAEQSEARVRVGLPALKVKTRKCISCGSLFESVEERTCGCSEEKRSQLASYMGVDVLVGY